MKNKITYLLGAGASAQQVPIVSEFRDRLDPYSQEHKAPLVTFYQWALAYKSAMTNPKDKVFDDEVFLFTKSVAKILTEIGGETIDKLAKTYVINSKRDELSELKSVLTAYFLFEQLFNRDIIRYGANPTIKALEEHNHRVFDSRYFTFWKDILRQGNNFQLPPNVSILSWNYDLQSEISYHHTIDELKKSFTPLKTVKSFLKTITPDFIDCDDDGFTFSKLNGEVGFGNSTFIDNCFFTDGVTIESKTEEILYHFKYSLPRKLLNDFPYLKKDIKYEPSLKFSFEYNVPKEFLNKVLKRVSGTDVLVVIGYSFQEENREIDMEIIKEISKTCRKIYFQLPNQEDFRIYSDRLQSMWKSVRKPQIKAEYKINSFCLPSEFFEERKVVRANDF